MSTSLETDAAPLEDTSHRRKRRKGRIVLISAIALVVLALALAGGYLLTLAQTFNTQTTKIDTAFPEEATRPQKAGPATGPAAVNILIMGSDSRGATEIDAKNGVATDQRADTLMLMHIPADRKNVYTVSLMRDLWVQIPNHGQAKINAALALGGVPLMVQTVESIFGQRIDHVAMVDFDGFKGLTDALGGVTVNVTVPFSHGGEYFAAGPNTLNGQQALGFVRERYSFADGDYQRVRNQQAFMKGLAAKTLDAKTLSNPLTISNMVSAVSPFISVDKGLDAATIAGLALELKDVRQQNIMMFTIPTRGTGWSDDGQSIVLVDNDAISAISSALAKDDLGSYVTAHGLEKGN